MSRPRRRRLFGSTAATSSASGNSHGDRPWVFFMVDCFFLITEFFVIIFKFKTEELNLPGRLPPGGGCGGLHRSADETLYIHLLQTNGQTMYVVQAQTITLPELESKLALAGGRTGLSVKISYESAIPWGDIVAVMNACTRVSIMDVGLQPLRATDAQPGPVEPGR